MEKQHPFRKIGFQNDNDIYKKTTPIMSDKIADEERLKACPKISAARSPSVCGTKWTARIIYVKDADTVVVARFCPHSDQLEARTVRTTLNDCPEVFHSKSKIQPSKYEAMLGYMAKTIILNKMLPDQFKVVAEEMYDWRKQKKVFDQYPVIVEVDCPALDSKGKTVVPDPYFRDLGKITVTSCDEPWDVAQTLINLGLADPYEGGKKERTFMKSTKCLDNLGSIAPADAIRKAHDAFQNLLNDLDTSSPRSHPADS